MHFSGVAFPRGCVCSRAAAEVGCRRAGPQLGPGREGTGRTILLAVTPGERGASLHFAKAKTLLMRVMGAPATAVIHCGLKELAQQFQDKPFLSK